MKMTKSVIYLLVLFVISAHARITVHDKQIPDTSNNVLQDNEKLKKSNTEIRIDLPTTSEITSEATNTAKSNPNEAGKGADSSATTTEGPLCTNHSQEITDNTIDSDDKPCVPEIKIDNGTALLLTPFIKEGRIDEARNASKVNPELFLDIESYSGFITVEEKYDSNVFFWYFPIEKKPVNEMPWIIWLQGGPGASSMTGLFDEIGPFFVTVEGTLLRNPFSWLRNHSLLFIDNPVGTGYSYTNHVDGFTRDMDTYSTHLYTVLKQFLQMFPELRAAPLFIAGESYAGKYVPALAMQIHRHKHAPDGDINLQGLIVGNGYVDPGMIANMARPFYYFGLLETEQIDIVRPLLDAFQQDIAANRSIEAKGKWNHIITILLLLTHQKHAYNFLRDDLQIGRYLGYLRRADVKRALHVGDINFSFVNMTVNVKLNGDFLSTAKPLYEELLDEYRVLTYCGQLDQMLSCVVTSENYRTWRWNASTEFLEATRYPYIYGSKLSGYHKSGGRLTEVVIRGAGHMAPLDMPGPTQHLVARWVRAEPLSHRFGLLDGSFVQEYVRNNSATHLHYL